MTLAERFWSHVDKSGECWLWTAKRNAKGYGSFGTTGGQCALAHRVSWALECGPIPPRLLVLHSLSCSSRACVRPTHLRLGTQKENVADTMSLGRAGCQQGPPAWVGRPELQWLRVDPDSAVRDSRGRIVTRQAAALSREARTT